MGVALSFLRNFGILSGASGVLGALSAGVATLANDERYDSARATRQQERNITGVGEGLAEGGEALGAAFYRGLTGLVAKPLEGAKRAGVGGASQAPLPLSRFRHVRVWLCFSCVHAYGNELDAAYKYRVTGPVTKPLECAKLCWGLRPRPLSLLLSLSCGAYVGVYRCLLPWSHGHHMGCRGHEGHWKEAHRRSGPGSEFWFFSQYLSREVGLLHMGPMCV
jgi:hypothetical protein